MNPRQHALFLWIANRRALFLSLLAFSLTATIALAYWHGTRLALENTDSVFEDRISSHKYFLLSVLGKYALIPETVAVLPDVKNMLRDPSPEHVDAATRALVSIADENDIDRLYVIGGDGTTLASSFGPARPSIAGVNYAFRPYFKEAMSGRASFFTAIGVSSPVLGFYVSHPVRIDNEVRGVVSMRLSISLDTIRDAVRGHWMQHADIPLITDENGVVLMSPVEHWMYRSVEPLPQAVWQAMQDSQRYSGKTLDPIPYKVVKSFNEQARLVEFADLPGQTFIRKVYDVPEFGGKIFLHMNAAQYWDDVIKYTTRATLLALVVFLLAMYLFQRWTYQIRLIDTAIRDPLTGLYTRLYMNEWLSATIRQHERHHDQGFALAMFDVDYFKKINDTHGHLIGDAVLKEIGGLIRASIRAEDVAVRFGGEELAVFLRVASKEEAAAICDRIRSTLAARGISVEQGDIFVTVSCGIACHQLGEGSASLFARADAKLYEAKHAGRNRVCY